MHCVPRDFYSFVLQFCLQDNVNFFIIQLVSRLDLSQTSSQQGLHNRASWILLIGTSVNFALQIVQWVMQLTWFIITLKIYLVDNANLSLQDRVSLDIKAANLFVLPLDNLETVPVCFICLEMSQNIMHHMFLSS